MSHGGSIQGFRSIIFRYVRDDLSVIVLFNTDLDCNQDDVTNYYFAEDVADLVYGNKLTPRDQPGSGDRQRRTPPSSATRSRPPIPAQ